jgi:hypothetical protein
MLCKVDVTTTNPPLTNGGTSALAEQPQGPAEPDHHASKLAAARYGISLDDPNCKDMILVMGSRGAGKSLFINTLVGGNVAQVGDGITQCMYISMIIR